MELELQIKQDLDHLRQMVQKLTAYDPLENTRQEKVVNARRIFNKMALTKYTVSQVGRYYKLHKVGTHSTAIYHRKFINERSKNAKLYPYLFKPLSIIEKQFANA